MNASECFNKYAIHDESKRPIIYANKNAIRNHKKFRWKKGIIMVDFNHQIFIIKNQS